MTASSARFQAVKDGAQACLDDILPDAVLAGCKEWESQSNANESSTKCNCKEWESQGQAASESPSSAKYNCANDEYLRTLEPGKYSGVVANYLSFNTITSSPHFRTRAALLEGCTGGKIIFAEANDIAEDPIKDIGTSMSVGSGLYDAYLMIYSFTTEASSLGLLETLNDRIRASNQLLKYEDMYPKVRTMGEYRKDGKTNIDLLMTDGDFFVPVVRIDLLERDGKPLPHTWEDLVELAKFYNGTDLNDDGIDDYGFCIYPRTGSGFNDAWIPELMYSTWATTDQTRGIQEGFFFDERTFEPRIGNGFANAMDIWKELWGISADGCVTPNFVAGRCAIALGSGGCHKSIFVGSETGGVARRNETDPNWTVLTDENGKPLWRPTMKDGSYAEPYRFRPFGSLRVVDRKSGQFVECAPDTCPKGERILFNSELPTNDRARLLVESPHVDKWINRVPFSWSGGYGTGIRKSASPEAKDLMWDFFVYVNTPITSMSDVVKPSWLDEWRYSQMSDGNKQTYINAGYSEIAWKEHSNLMNYALKDQVNFAMTLRLPGILAYTRDIMLPKFTAYMNGLISMEEAKESVRQGWEDVTSARGKLKQVQIYRASLGLDALSSSEVCLLHPEESAVCEMNYIGNTRWIGYALGFILIFMAIFFGGWVAVNRKHRVITMSQPIFLHIICFGAVVLANAIFPLGIDDSNADVRGCNAACMSTPWLVSIGFSLIISALFSKLWRINRVFTAASTLKRVTVKEKDVLAPFAVLMSLNFVILLSWTLLDPLLYERTYGNETSTSYGHCASQGTQWKGFLAALGILNFSALVVVNIQAYKARNINDELSESKYIGLSTLSMSQIFVVGVPLLFIVHKEPSAYFFVWCGIIFIVCSTILLLIFVPKIIRWKSLVNKNKKSSRGGPSMGGSVDVIRNRISQDAVSRDESHGSSMETSNMGSAVSDIRKRISNQRSSSGVGSNDFDSTPVSDSKKHVTFAFADKNSELAHREKLHELQHLILERHNIDISSIIMEIEGVEGMGFEATAEVTLEDPCSSDTDEGYTRFLQLVLSGSITPELPTPSVHSTTLADEENVTNTGMILTSQDRN